jgi:hypothetical protein
MPRIKSGQLCKEQTWRQEYEADQESIDLMIWHIQNLEEEYLKAPTPQIIDQMHYWYGQIDSLRNKHYM